MYRKVGLWTKYAAFGLSDCLGHAGLEAETTGAVAVEVFGGLVE
jgi:hypothetical protein